MKKIVMTLLVLFVLFNEAISFANPLNSSFSRMNSVLEQNGVANPNVTLGIKLHVPVNDPSNWAINLDVPRNKNNLCDKSDSSQFGLVTPTKPCMINPEK